MSNVYRADFRRTNQQQEPPGGHVADLENGYLRLANQIQDAVCKVELSGREFRVLNAIIRLTYGWSKKEDRITNSLIADKTGLAVKHVSEAVLSIANRRIISLRRIGQTRYIGINTNIAQWAYTKPNCPKCIFVFSPISEPEILMQVITIPENRDNHPQIQGEVSPETGNTKDILPKTNKQKDLKPPLSPKPEKPKSFDPLSIPIPEWLNQTAWMEWVSYRASSKKPMQTELTVTKAFKMLKDCLDAGHNPVDVIDASIANGYQGLFPPKYPARKPVRQPAKPMNHIPEGFR